MIFQGRAASIAGFMSVPPSHPDGKSGRLVFATAAVFAVVTTVGSYLRWATFQYRTFDLAFYVQTLWQCVHGRFDGSLLNVPLLGNHAEPVVFLLAPLFALWPHPMLLVAVQAVALACLAPVGFRICRRLGMDERASALLAIATLLAPATGFVALHEFHPEAFSALFLLLMFEARLRLSQGRFWLWFAAALGCKENVALLLVTYGAVHALLDRPRWFRWGVLPMLAAVGWLALYGMWLGPLLNHGNVEYGALYSHLGSSAGDIAMNFLVRPGRALGALAHALRQGNLWWGILLPFLALPLLRARWLIIASPVLLQHLLSWRSSEWQIYFHYGAPLIALFWIAAVEALARRPFAPYAARLIVFACLTAQIWIGPGRKLAEDAASAADDFRGSRDKAGMLARIPPRAGVLASMGFLSHLATRETLFSLHHVLKGLKTLSRADYPAPPPTDAVLIDYGDSATFDAFAGYYHPKMRTEDGRVIPSSDALLHLFLRQADWRVESCNSITLFNHLSRGPGLPPADPQQPIVAEIDSHTRLVSIGMSGGSFSAQSPLVIRLVWNFRGEREIFPWLILELQAAGDPQPVLITKGLCAPEGRDDGRNHEERWQVVPPAQARAGLYQAKAIFVDNTRMAWERLGSGAPGPSPVLKRIDLGVVRIGGPPGNPAP